MFRLMVLAVAGAALAGPLTAAAQSAAERIGLGDEAHRAFEPTKALEHYEGAIALEPENATALGNASRSAVDAGEQLTERGAMVALFRKGEQYARRAVAADPGNAENHFHLARALGKTALSVGVRERVKYAVEIRSTAMEALARDSLHPGALHVMGVWNAEIMRLNGVERFFARNFLGGKVFGQANWKDAVSYMERAVEVDPDRLTHRLDLAQIYVSIGEKAKAREQFQRVIDGPRTDVNDPTYKRQAEEALRRLK
ncbi:MAG: tetratricopeptide repeat protein [Gemmatimonadota bacterium]